MDYHPNIDGARWFAREVFPEIRRRRPGAEFLIVGNRPVREVLELAKGVGVVVTGGVEDVRPYIAQACAVVAPLQLARGIQNKVLEGLALGSRFLAARLFVKLSAGRFRKASGNARARRILSLKSCPIWIALRRRISTFVNK